MIIPYHVTYYTICIYIYIYIHDNYIAYYTITYYTIEGAPPPIGRGNGDN